MLQGWSWRWRGQGMEQGPSLKTHPVCFLWQQVLVQGSRLVRVPELELVQAQGQQQGWTMALPQQQVWS